MSYEKVAAVTTVGSEEPAKIRFFYPVESIFNKLDLKTHYRAKVIKDQTGAAQLDDYAISQDERDWVLEYLNYATFQIGTNMFKMARGVANSIFFNSNLDGDLTEESVGFELVDNAAYNSNLLKVIDGKILLCFLHYCLREWYGTVALVDDIKANDILYEKHITDLNNLTFQLRKPTM